MILLINTIEPKIIETGLYDTNSEKWLVKEKIESAKQSRELLLVIDKMFQDNNITLDDIKTILVNTDFGSYTGTRIGTTVANTLAWSKDIPVLSYTENTLNKVLNEAKNYQNKGFTKLVMPQYKTNNKENN